MTVTETETPCKKKTLEFKFVSVNINFSSLEKLAHTFPYVEEDAEYEWPMNKEVERKIKRCKTDSGIDVRSLDEFILDDLCFEIPENTMAINDMITFPCRHAKDTSRYIKKIITC